MFFRVMKKRVFWRRSLFLIKTAKIGMMNFPKKRQNKLKMPKKAYKTNKKASFYIKMTKK